MNYKPLAVILLILFLLGACTRKAKTETHADEVQAPVEDPTPPAPPNSEEVSADLKNMPAFMTMAIGGIADEGEKEGIDVQENLRLFRTDTTAQEIVSFYAKEMKDRGWTTDNQVARSKATGLSIQEYRRAGSEALYLIVSEPEDSQSSDPTKARRYVALLPAKVRKPKP
jgi:hypothetical protein